MRKEIWMRWSLHIQASAALCSAGLIGFMPCALLRAQEPQSSPPKIVVEVNRVLVPVVVRDVHGHVVREVLI